MELNNLKGKVSTYLYLHVKEVIQKKKNNNKKHSDLPVYKSYIIFTKW